ncbi:MAG: hypothetical protein WB615_11190 [Candidatus Tumulicola sp.]
MSPSSNHGPESEYPKPSISKEEYDTPDFWENYLNRVYEVLPTAEPRQSLGTILSDCYECGNYEEALARLEDLARPTPASIEVTWPYIRFCRNVVTTVEHPEDTERARAYKRWKMSRDIFPAWLFKMFYKRRPTFIRCKYCARYIPYQHPNSGLAYLGGNQCEHCGRSYPAPSLRWDSVGGQAYIFYRRSVKEPEFYRDTVKLFDVVNFNNEMFADTTPPGL